jgi:hypothetical protein
MSGYVIGKTVQRTTMGNVIGIGVHGGCFEKIAKAAFWQCFGIERTNAIRETPIVDKRLETIWDVAGDITGQVWRL